MIMIKRTVFNSNKATSFDVEVSKKDFLEMLIPWVHLLTTNHLTMIFSSDEISVSMNEANTINIFVGDLLMTLFTQLEQPTGDHVHCISIGQKMIDGKMKFVKLLM